MKPAEAKKKGLKLPADLNLKPKGKAFENFVGDEEAAPTGKPSYQKKGASFIEPDGSGNDDISDDPIA